MARRLSRDHRTPVIKIKFALLPPLGHEREKLALLGPTTLTSIFNSARGFAFANASGFPGSRPKKESKGGGIDERCSRVFWRTSVLVIVS